MPRHGKKVYSCLLLVCMIFPLKAISKENSQERIDALEKQIETMDKQLKTLKKSTRRGFSKQSKMLDQLNSKFDIRGFVSLGITKNIDDFGIGSEITANDTNFKKLTRAGIQIQAKLTDKISLVNQLRSKLTDDPSVDMTWAYVKYQLSDQDFFHIGRFRSQVFSYSEIEDVGFAYHFSSLPILIYLAEPISQEGISYNRRFEIANLNALFTIAHGIAEIDVDNGGQLFRSNDYLSTRLKVFHGYSTFSVSYSRDRFLAIGGFQQEALSSALGSVGTEAAGFSREPWREFYDIAYSYDDGINFISFEYIRQVFEKGILGNKNAGFISFGRYFNRTTVYFTASHTYSPASSDDKMRDLIEFAQSVQSSATSVSTRLAARVVEAIGEAQIFNAREFEVGVRYDLSSRMAIKASYSLVNGFDDIGQGRRILRDSEGETIITANNVASSLKYFKLVFEAAY